MTNTQEIKEKLEKFGLSNNQASIYLLLVAHHELRVQEIVKLTQIPRSSVYESLSGLFELGLVEEIIDDNFKKIKPYGIGLIRHRLNEKILEFQKQASELNGLEKALTLLPSTQSLDSTTIRYYKGIPGARQLLWSSLKAKNTVYVYSAWGRGKAVGMKFYESFVRESHERSIKEKVLINPTTKALDSIKRYNGSSISRTKINDIRTLNEEDVLIKGETFIYDNVYAQIYLTSEKINGFEIESNQFTQTQRSIFETLWKIAKPFSLYLSKKPITPEI